MDHTEDLLSPESEQLLDVRHVKNISRTYMLGLVSRLGRKIREKATLAKQSVQALAASMSLSHDKARSALASTHAKALQSLESEYKENLRILLQEVC